MYSTNILHPWRATGSCPCYGTAAIVPGSTYLSKHRSPPPLHALFFHIRQLGTSKRIMCIILPILIYHTNSTLSTTISIYSGVHAVLYGFCIKSPQTPQKKHTTCKHLVIELSPHSPPLPATADPTRTQTRCWSPNPQRL